MWELTAQAAALLARDHGVVARLRASVNGSGFVVDLPLVEGGEVKLDASSLTRRTLSCQVVADFDSPTVDPLSAEVRAEYGIVAPSGTTYWTPVGTFVLTEAREAGDGLVELTGADRWQRVLDARFERPTTTSGDTVAAIVQLLQDADPRISVDTSAAPIGATHSAALWERDRGEAVQQLARSIGAEVFFRPDGVAVVKPAAQLSDPVVWEVGRGRGGAKISHRAGVSRERSYNAVAVTGTPQGLPPVYGVARVGSGPLRWGGPFGKRTRFWSSPLISTEAQALAAAQALLSRVQGVARSLELDALPNPALEGGDVLQVELSTGVWQRHMVQALTLPLGLGTTPIATRADAEDDGGE